MSELHLHGVLPALITPSTDDGDAIDVDARAVVWRVASILPAQCVELHRLLVEDIDLPAARALWSRLWPLCRHLGSQSYAAAVKAACALVGDRTGPVRPPLLPPDPGPLRELLALAQAAPVQRSVAA